MVTSSETSNDIITHCLHKRYNNFLPNNFRKLKRIIVIIFAKQHERCKEKLTVQQYIKFNYLMLLFTLQNEKLS